MERQYDPILASCSKRIERATDLSLFLQEGTNQRLPLYSSDEEAIIVDNDERHNFDFLNDGEDVGDGVFFNIDYSDIERSWLTDILQEEHMLAKSYDVQDEYKDVLKIHKKKKELASNEMKMDHNKYDGIGLVSNFDKSPENKKAVLAKYPKKKPKIEELPPKQTFYSLPEILQDMSDEQCVDFDIDNGIDIQNVDEDSNKVPETRKEYVKTSTSKKQKGNRFKDDEAKKKREKMMQSKCKQIFTSMVKKEISKQRSKENRHKEILIQCKKVALQCQKSVRNKALQSARAVKELQWRMKRLAQEDLAYWKRSKRVDLEMRRKLEKEAEEQRKMDFELIEAKRQERKLNFLISQTELYAHFMSKKIGDSSPEEQMRILSQLDELYAHFMSNKVGDSSPEEQMRILSQPDEDKNPRLANIDDYDSELMKAKAIRNAQDAIQCEKARTRQLDMEVELSIQENNILDTSNDMERQCDPILASCSKPLHVQRIERATDLSLFLQERTNERLPLCSSDEEAIIVDNDERDNCDFLNDGEDGGDGVFLNVDYSDIERSWLTEILQEEQMLAKSYDVKDEYKDVLKIHKKKKKLGSNEMKMDLNKYYGTGLVSNFDKYPENKKAVLAKYPKKKPKIEESPPKQTFYSLPEILQDMSDEQCVDFDIDNGIDIQNVDEDSNKVPETRKEYVKTSTSKKQKGKRFKDDEAKKKWEGIMQSKRKKIFTSMVKKEISKQQRSKVNRHKEMLIQCKKVALQCQKSVRNKALQSARAVKELQWRMKRLARENLAYWKRSKRVDREMRRKLEKEAEEQRKMDFELIEAKRQQRKLNFLITQTELYAHFMSKKIGDSSPEEQMRILSQLDEDKNPRLANIDDYDSELMKAKAIRNAQDAFQCEKARTKLFDMEAKQLSIQENNILDTSDGDHIQPIIFQGTLKAYQLRGMNWLANLYDQGISGILADEMGLGKTVQSIAFLSHLAETQDLWGPFLVICPASTLHNWQQEFAKFVPLFKVVPYWGNPADRKILRQFWNQDGMHTKDAGFHVVITSYQIVISDVKYFNRIKWQYMVLDEAQAIKSTSSMRWKTLLGFNCRNRLLLSGTPIQNSMAELWALLHFIMPTLFDSHEEFNEWFSKDIESHAENKTGIDEKHLSRLHMILKPFMLRRIKKDVENELSDKIEVMVYCPLTTRQRLLYKALKQKIRIEDLLHYSVGGGDSHSVDKNFTSNLMNLVMQFRKVCNHPELFERRDAKSPIFIPPYTYEIPYEIFDFNVREVQFMILKKYFLFSPEYIANAIRNYDTIFNFCIALRLSVDDVYKILQGDILRRWCNFFEIERHWYNLSYRRFWADDKHASLIINPEFRLSLGNINMSSTLQDFIFTSKNTGKKVVYTHSTHYYHTMAETVEHRNIRCRNLNDEVDTIIDVVNDESPVRKGSTNTSMAEFPYEERTTQVFSCQRTELPAFLFSLTPKVITHFQQFFCSSRRVAHHWKRHIDDWSLNSLNYYYIEATNKNISGSNAKQFYPVPKTSVDILTPMHGWSRITIPDKETLVTDSGKLSVLDGLLKRLKEEGHRVLIYSQMTKMIDLLEEYMWHRHHKYMRLDGSSKISERRDMVADFQARTDIFVFLLSTRAGGLGINLTAADTVIFYDSDWNPTVDQQAMDRAHRLGQTKQVTVYRLICKGSIEERILQRAREKSEIQKLVISGGNFKPDTLKPKEVVSLLLDDEEIEQKYRQRAEERKHLEDMRELDRKRKYMTAFKTSPAIVEVKKKSDSQESGFGEFSSFDSTPNSPRSENSPDIIIPPDEANEPDYLDIEGDVTSNNKFSSYNVYNSSTIKPRVPGRGTSKRGRPRGSRRMSALGRFNSNNMTNTCYSSHNVAETQVNENSPSTSMVYEASPSTSQTCPTNSSFYNNPIRRGPGRPRLKPGGPSNAGSRGTYRPRKPAKPLPVPLPSDGTSTSNSVTAGPSYSTYLYNFPEQSDS